MAIDTTSAFVVDHDGIGISKENSPDEELILWIGGGDAIPAFDAPVNSRYYRTNGDVYRQEGPGLTAWALLASVSSDNNIDGGFANSTYLPDQCFDGGAA